MQGRTGGEYRSKGEREEVRRRCRQGKAGEAWSPGESKEVRGSAEGCKAG